MARVWDEAFGAARGDSGRSGPGHAPGRSEADAGYKGHLRALFDGIASKAGPDEDWHGPGARAGGSPGQP